MHVGQRSEQRRRREPWVKDVVGPVRYGGQLLIADQGVKVRTCRVAQAGLGNIGDDAMALVTPAEALRAQGEQQQACGKSLHPVDLTPGGARLFAPVRCKVEECPGCPLNFRGGVSSAFSTSSVTARKRQGGVRRGCSSIPHADRPQSHSANLIPVTRCGRRCCTMTSASSCSLWMNSWRF